MHHRPLKHSAATLLLALLATPCFAAMDAAELLQQCLHGADVPANRSRVEVEVTHKSTPAESFHLVRRESPQLLFVAEDGASGQALLQRKHPSHYWFYDRAQQRFSAALPENGPAWLLSETLLDRDTLASFTLAVTSQSSMGGQSYYTITATTTADDPFPKRSLSLKMYGNQQCDLIRAAYFGPDHKLRKKIYVQWQPLADGKMLKALHIEDVQSLEAIRYHIEEPQVVEQFDAADLPSPPALPN